MSSNTPCWLTAKVFRPVSPYWPARRRSEAGDHVAVDEIVVGAAGDVVVLAGQDLVLVAKIAFALGGIVELDWSSRPRLAPLTSSVGLASSLFFCS